MAKIAIEQASSPPSARVLARGKGWAVSDIICTAGPHDRPFEEQHSSASIAIVVSGTFQYRSSIGQELMTPASVLLGCDWGAVSGTVNITVCALPASGLCVGSSKFKNYLVRTVFQPNEDECIVARIDEGPGLIIHPNV